VRTAERAGVTPRIARSTFKADEVTAQESDAMSYAASASAFVLTLYATIGPISAQGYPGRRPDGGVGASVGFGPQWNLHMR
jgi:hypothetical protein